MRDSRNEQEENMEIHQPIIIYSAEPWQRVRANNPAEVNWAPCVLKSSEQHCTASLGKSEWQIMVLSCRWNWLTDWLTDWLHKFPPLLCTCLTYCELAGKSLSERGWKPYNPRNNSTKRSPQRLPLQCELSTNKPSAADVNPGPPARRAAPGCGEGWVAAGPACETCVLHHQIGSKPKASALIMEELHLGTHVHLYIPVTWALQLLSRLLIRVGLMPYHEKHVVHVLTGYSLITESRQSIRADQ